MDIVTEIMVQHKNYVYVQHLCNLLSIRICLSYFCNKRVVCYDIHVFFVTSYFKLKLLKITIFSEALHSGTLIFVTLSKECDFYHTWYHLILLIRSSSLSKHQDNFKTVTDIVGNLLAPNHACMKDGLFVSIQTRYFKSEQ